MAWPGPVFFDMCGLAADYMSYPRSMGSRLQKSLFTCHKESRLQNGILLPQKLYKTLLAYWILNEVLLHHDRQEEVGIHLFRFSFNSNTHAKANATIL